MSVVVEVVAVVVVVVVEFVVDVVVVVLVDPPFVEGVGSVVVVATGTGSFFL